jgi:uncharacterized protein
MEAPIPVVLDTNVFVAAGFNPGSASARLLEAVRAGALRMLWSEATARETRAVLERIPRLSWEDAEAHFSPGGRWEGEADPERFPFVEDAEDRKFAALATAAGAVLVTADDHLLSQRGRIPAEVLTPSEAVRRLGLQP